MKYIIDTNIIIDHLRIGELKASDFLKQIENGEIQAFISVVTEYELLAIKLKKKEEEIIEEIFSLMPTISATSEIVRQAALFYKKYQISMADGIIAATAFRAKAIIVTRDNAFLKIKEVKVENLKK